MIIEKFMAFLDRNLHQKRIGNFLQNKSIKTIIDVGAHKGETVFNFLNDIFHHDKLYLLESLQLN